MTPNKKIKSNAFIDWLKQKKSNVLYLLFAIFVIGYVFFFMSGWLFQDKTEYSFTPLNVEKSYDNERAFTVIGWDYSPSQQLMEVRLKVKNIAYTENTIWKYDVKTRDDNNKLSVEKILNEKNYVVLHISNVKPKWHNVMVMITIEGQDNLNVLKLFNAEDKINVVNKIEKATKDKYYILNYENEINLLKEQIEEQNEKINGFNTKITNLTIANNDLEDSKVYKTKDEIVQTDEQIASNVNTINSYKDDIADCQQTIDGLNESIGLYQNLIVELSQ